MSKSTVRGPLRAASDRGCDGRRPKRKDGPVHLRRSATTRGFIRRPALATTAAAAAMLAVGGGIGGATGAASCELPTFGPGDAYLPQITPRDFSPNVTNPFFPLKPGRTLVYTGTKDGKKALNIVLTTSRTKVVDRVRTRVV